MDSNRELKLELRRALDEVYPPAPWLASAVRDELRKRRRISWTDRVRAQPPQMRVAMVAGVALMLIAAIAAAALFAAQLYGPAPVKTQRFITGDASVPIRSAYFLNGREAVVVAQRGLLLTKDGGQHWSLTLKLDWKTVDYFKFVDSNQIVVLSGSQTGKQLISTTTDGGVHWQTKPSGLVSDYTYRTMFFLDTSEGWAMETASPSREPGPITVHHTRDGGVHWTRMWYIASASVANGLLFTDSMHGFMGSYNYDGVARLYVTSDGGATWQVAEVPRPPDGWHSGCCSKVILEPQLTMSGGHGFLVIAFLPQAAVYATSDYGRSWTFSHLLPAEVRTVQFLDPYHWLAAGGQDLFETSDSGLSWRRVALHLPTNGYPSLGGLSSSSSTDLWGVIGASIPEVPDSTCFQAFGPTCSFLIRSTDGGATWSIVKMPAAI